MTNESFYSGIRELSIQDWDTTHSQDAGMSWRWNGFSELKKIPQSIDDLADKHEITLTDTERVALLINIYSERAARLVDDLVEEYRDIPAENRVDILEEKAALESINYMKTSLSNQLSSLYPVQFGPKVLTRLFSSQVMDAGMQYFLKTREIERLSGGNENE